MKNIITVACTGAIALLSVVTISNMFNKSSSDENANTAAAQAAVDYVSLADNAVEPVTETAVNKTEITDKDTYYHKLLNTVDYYDAVSGKIETNMLNGNDFTVEYSVDMLEGTAYQHVLSSDFDEEVFVGEGIVQTRNNLSEEKAVYRKDSAVKKSDDKGNYENDDKRVGTYNGAPAYEYRMNPTNLHYASTLSIFPQEMTFGFLSDKSLWEISGEEELLGRNVIVVKGVTAPEYGQKLNINNFEMKIDSTTGILLWFEGYNQAGECVSYMNTTEFSE